MHKLCIRLHFLSSTHDYGPFWPLMWSLVPNAAWLVRKSATEHLDISGKCLYVIHVMFPLNEHGLRLPIDIVWSSTLEMVTTQPDSLEHPALVGPALNVDCPRKTSRLPFHLNWSDSYGLQQFYSGGRFKKTTNHINKKNAKNPQLSLLPNNR